MYSVGVLGWFAAVSATCASPWVSAHAYVTKAAPGHGKPPTEAAAATLPNSCSAPPRAATVLDEVTLTESGHAKHTVPLPARPVSMGRTRSDVSRCSVTRARAFAHL